MEEQKDLRAAYQALIKFLIHLRMKFVAILVPIFLWGAFVSEGRLGASFWFGFVLFHVSLYGGINALNSYYDRDEGPIGGLVHPPKVDRSLFYLAWGIQILGLVLTFFLPLSFVVIYLSVMAMSVLYSHPVTRLKGHPLGSSLIVSSGQGLLPYWAGWIASGAAASSIFSLKGILGGLAITFVTLGLYPLTQIYQIDSDRAKGDRTLAIHLGVNVSFRFALVGIVLSGACMITLLWIYVHRFQGFVLLGYFVALWTIVYRWGRNFQPLSRMGNYNMVMRLNLINSGAFTLYLALHFFNIL